MEALGRDDVLHRYEEPARAMMEKILNSDEFGVAEIVGSIGCAQRTISAQRMKWKQKQELSIRLKRWFDSWHQNEYNRVYRFIEKLHYTRIPCCSLRP